LLHVDEVERQHVETTRRQTIGKEHHKTTRLVGARSMAQHYCDAGAVLFPSRINKRRHGILIIDLDGQFIGFDWHLNLYLRLFSVPLCLCG
jgi:hypothetical protein